MIKIDKNDLLQVNETQAGSGTSPGEMLSRRCVSLLKMALKPDVWPNCDLKLTAFEKILAGPQGVDSNQPNYVNICTCLDILSFLLTILRKEQASTGWLVDCPSTSFVGPKCP